MQVIYVDVLILLNFILDFLILRITGYLASLAPSLTRLTAAALVGAGSSLFILLPQSNRLFLLTVRLLTALAMVLLIQPDHRPRALLKALACLMATSLFSAGMVFAAMLWLHPEGNAFPMGVLYFEIGVPTLFVCFGISALLVKGMALLLERRPAPALLCEVTIQNRGRIVQLSALLDTGCALVEPFSGKPVLLCERDAVRTLLPDALCDCSTQCAAGQGIRLIPYRTIDHDGLAPAFLPERMFIRKGSSQKRLEGIYLAISSRAFGSGEPKGILNPSALRFEAKGSEKV